MEKWYVYLIENTKGKIYIGASSNIKKHIISHNRVSGTDWTQGKGRWVLIHFEIYPDKNAALKREKQLKSWKAGKRIKELLNIN